MTAPTTRETADHAELARRTMEQLNLMAGGKQTLFGSVAVAQMAVELNETLLSEIAALRGDLTETRVAADLLVSSVRADLRQAERQRDELRKALEPFAALADRFGCWSVVEVCAPEPGNKSPVIQPLPLSAFETAAALLANQGAE